MTVVLIKGDEGCRAFAIGGQIDVCCFRLDLMGTRGMILGLLNVMKGMRLCYGKAGKSVCQISLELWAWGNFYTCLEWLYGYFNISAM